MTLWQQQKEISSIKVKKDRFIEDLEVAVASCSALDRHDLVVDSFCYAAIVVGQLLLAVRVSTRFSLRVHKPTFSIRVKISARFASHLFCKSDKSQVS